MADDVEIALLTMTFVASDADALMANLSRYVVLTRGVEGCRNVDLCASVAKPDVFVIIQKWESDDHARDHVSSQLMIEMANSCQGILTTAPDIDLLQGISAHDLN
jgi:quinol monooxygenase YgiN